jgi:hypothetical protein
MMVKSAPNNVSAASKQQTNQRTHIQSEKATQVLPSTDAYLRPSPSSLAQAEQTPLHVCTTDPTANVDDINLSPTLLTKDISEAKLSQASNQLSSGHIARRQTECFSNGNTHSGGDLHDRDLLALLCKYKIIVRITFLIFTYAQRVRTTLLSGPRPACMLSAAQSSGSDLPSSLRACCQCGAFASLLASSTAAADVLTQRFSFSATFHDPRNP